MTALRRLLLLSTILTIAVPCAAVWAAPRHPRSVHKRRNTGRWDG